MKASKIVMTVGTYALVGAVSVAGAALWTYVLEDKVKQIKSRVTHPKSDNVIDIAKVREEQIRRNR